MGVAMFPTKDDADVFVTGAKPLFFGRQKEGLYWISDAHNRLVMVFANREAAESLYRQMGRVLDLNEPESQSEP